MSKGMTLMEVMVASALFLAFIVVAGELVVHMMADYRQGEEIVRPIAQARNAMGLMGSSWRSATQIVVPQGMKKADWESELAYGAERVTLQIYNDQTRYLRFSCLDNTLLCEELLGRYGPVQSTRKLLSPVNRLKFWRTPRDPVVSIELETTSGVSPPTPYSLQTLTLCRSNPATQ